MDHGANSRRLIVTDGGVAQAGPTVAYTYGQLTQAAAAFQVDGFSLAQSGVLATEDTSGTMPTVDRLFIGTNAFSTLSVNGHIRRLVYWPQRLGNEVLQRITQ
jgi:hypothetical protein